MNRKLEPGVYAGERIPFSRRSNLTQLLGKKIGYDRRNFRSLNYGIVTDVGPGYLEINFNIYDIKDLEQVVVLRDQEGS